MGNSIAPIIGQLRAPRTRVKKYGFQYERKDGTPGFVSGYTMKTRWTEVWCGWDWVPIEDWEARRTYYRRKAMRMGL